MLSSTTQAGGRRIYLLDRDDPPTAIFAASDELALGILEEARRRGLRVPEDLSVVGFDDTFVASRSTPPLTTVARARDRGINAHGPIPADALIPAAVRGKWNMIIACYHDQGHAPFKAVYGDNGVNITVGLPVVRVSVDHGTAFDIAGRGIAREASLMLSCRRAAELAPGWDNVWRAARQSQTASA